MLDDPIVARKPANPDPNLINDGKGAHGCCAMCIQLLQERSWEVGAGTVCATAAAPAQLRRASPNVCHADIAFAVWIVAAADFQPTTAKERHWDTVDYATFW
jgi:hypothetical protein